jgi:hypothetical protein
VLQRIPWSSPEELHQDYVPTGSRETLDVELVSALLLTNQSNFDALPVLLVEDLDLVEHGEAVDASRESMLHPPENYTNILGPLLVDLQAALLPILSKALPLCESFLMLRQALSPFLESLLMGRIYSFVLKCVLVKSPHPNFSGLFPSSNLRLVLAVKCSAKLFPIFVRDVTPVSVGLSFVGKLPKDRLLGSLPCFVLVTGMQGLGGFLWKTLRRL